MISCDIIVLTWNQLEIIKACVNSILKNTIQPCRLIIVDNCSKDGTVEYLSSLKGNDMVNIELILNNENLGFVGGMNKAMRLSEADYVCLMNNDILVTKGWLSKLIKTAESNPAIGIVNPASNTLGWFPPSGLSIDEYALNLEKNGSEYTELNACIGFCMLIKRELIKKIGYLSEDYMPIFFEDTDYSMRAKEKDYICVMSCSSYVWHDEHKSFKQLKKREEIFRRNRERFERRWGKFLRIVFIINEDVDTKIFKSYFLYAIKLAMLSNFVYIFLKNHQNYNRRDIFNLIHINEHANVNFVSIKNNIGFNLFCLWKIIKKTKKKYNLIIVFNPRLAKLLKLLKFLHKADIVCGLDEPKISELYKSMKFAKLDKEL